MRRTRGVLKRVAEKVDNFNRRMTHEDWVSVSAIHGPSDLGNIFEILFTTTFKIQHYIRSSIFTLHI